MLQAARLSLMFVLVAAPLAFGAVQPWAWGTMTMIVMGSLLLCTVGYVKSGSVTLIWSPLYLLAIPLLALAGVQLALGLTMDHVSTREATIKFITCLAIFFLAQHLFAQASERAWRSLAVLITAYAAVMAVYAVVQFFASPGVLYGTIQPQAGGYVFGPYVNHNHYAGLMEMLIPMVAGFAVGLRPDHPIRALVLFAGLVALVSVLLSGSRGGAAALAVEFVIFSACAWIAFPIAAARRRIVGCATLLLAVAAAMFWSLDPGEVGSRLAAMAKQPEIAAGDRSQIAADCLRMARDHVAYGVGLGAFEVAYPRYQTLVTDMSVDYAHNDFVQFFAEAGILGWVLALAGVLLFLMLAFRHLRFRLQREEGWLRLGAAVGVCGILVHSFCDFNLHIPANAAWFSFLAALAVAQQRRRELTPPSTNLY